MHGEPTDTAIVEQFRADYLYSGNAAKSGRKFGLSPSTARDIARRLVDDADFATERRRLRAIAVDEAERAVMQVIDTGLRRFKAPAPEIDIPEGRSGPNVMVTIVDKRPDYGKLVVDAHKSLVGRQRLDAEKSGEIQGEREVTIHVAPAVMPSDAGSTHTG